jgi:hypothetical protein
MTPREVAVLLELKRLRERRAEAALAEARRQEQAAAAAEAEAGDASRRFAAHRIEREDEIRDRLSGGAHPARDLLLAGATLAELSARGQQLRLRADLATREHERSRQASLVSNRQHSLAVGEAESLQALRDRLADAARVGEEHVQEAELDDAACLHPAPHPAIPGSRR